MSVLLTGIAASLFTITGAITDISASVGDISDIIVKKNGVTLRVKTCGTENGMDTFLYNNFGEISSQEGIKKNNSNYPDKATITLYINPTTNTFTITGSFKGTSCIMLHGENWGKL